MTTARRGRTGAIAGGLTGVAGGVAAAAGSALLLATGEGMLGALGLLAALALAAFAIGLWAGPPASRDGAGRRWVLVVVTFLIAALFGQFWLGATDLRASGLARALATLLLVAGPAYATGAIVALLLDRARAGPVGAGAGRAVPVAVLLGAAVGLVTAGGVLIPRFDPGPVFFGAAVVLGIAAAIETRDEAGTDDGRSMGMRDRTVIVTGVGARGQVGYAVAEAFLDAGANLVVTDVSDAVDSLARELASGAAGDRIAAVRADLTGAEGAEAVVAAARERFGRLDVLVNVAGGLTVLKPLAETSEEEWSGEVDRNGRTAFLMSRAALPLLRESGGAVVNFASPAGIRAVAGMAAYSAAKATVVAQTRALALEEKENGVRVNAIAPGMIDTEQNRESVDDPESVRWVAREQIADTVLFLASDAASGISGETVHVLG